MPVGAQPGIDFFLKRADGERVRRWAVLLDKRRLKLFDFGSLSGSEIVRSQRVARILDALHGGSKLAGSSLGR